MKKLFITDTLDIDCPPQHFRCKQLELEEDILSFIDIAESSRYVVTPAVKDKKNEIPIKHISGRPNVFNNKEQTSLDRSLILAICPSSSFGYNAFSVHKVGDKNV
jgi:hypothetical protein